MKKQVLYIHGGESFNDYDLFLKYLRETDIRDLPSSESYVKWTKKLPNDLGEEYEVFMPKMPNSENAKYEEWKIWFEEHFEYLKDDVIMIGCSLGAMFLTKYFCIKEAPFDIAGLILMAPAVQELTSVDFLVDLESVHVLAERAKKVEVWHSKDDFLVPFSHGELLHKAIPSSEFVVFEDKNHFLVEDLPELIEKIRDLG